MWNYSCCGEKDWAIHNISNLLMLDNIIMALTDASDLFCLVCNANVDFDCCTNIYYISLPHNGDILANFVMKVLKLSPMDLRSSYLCLQCYNLFGMLEQAQWTATNIQCEIFKVFKNSSNVKQEVTESISENERLNQINQSKINITNRLSEKDLSLLNNTSNTISSTSIISNQVDIKCKNVSYMINTNEKSYTSIKQCLENKISTEVEIADEISIFSEEIIQNPETENIKIFHWQEADGTSTLENNINNIENKDSNSVEPEATSATDSSDKIEKSGATAKCSQMPLKHACPSCDKEWRTSAELKTHVKSHSSLRPYMCEKCGQAYKHKHALEIHVGMHNGVSPYRCSHCDKCFTQKGALQRHLPMHTGETPYQCELCGKRFVHHTSYNMHVLSHTGKKSYSCQVCDLSLLSTSHLKRHMRVHTGEKPYSCDLCGKSFAERYNLLAHNKIHDPQQIYAKAAKRNQHKCNQCEASFSKKQMLADHLNQMHSVDAKIREKWLVDGSRDDLLETCVNEVWQSLSINEERLKINDNTSLFPLNDKHYECV